MSVSLRAPSATIINPHVQFGKNLQRRTWSFFQLWFSVGTDPKIRTVELDGKKIKLEMRSVTVILESELEVDMKSCFGPF